MSFSLQSIFSNISKKATTKSGPPDSTVGMDIGSSSIKVVELEQTDRSLALRTYGELQLAPYADKPLGETVILDVEKKTKALFDVLHESNVTSKRGALAMPLSSSFLTVMPLSVNGDTDISSRIPVEARKYVPLPLSDVTLDWTELSPLEGVEANVTEIMVAAIEKKALEDYNQLLTNIGMVGEPAEIEAFSLVRSLWKNDDSTLAIIDLGARTAKMYIVRDGVLERIHRVAVGGQVITARVAKLLNVTFDEAENLKRNYTRESEYSRDIYKTMATVLDKPLTEFLQFLTHYESRTGQPVPRIVITGGVAASPFVVPYIRDRWSREIEIGDSFAKVAYPAFMEDTLRDISPLFGVSLGAALRQYEYIN